MTQAAIILDVRENLQDSTSKLTDDFIIRAISEAVAEINRLFPRELVVESRFVLAHTDTTLTTVEGSAVTLVTNGNTPGIPVKPKSEVVTLVSDGTLYVRNTDYTMDYLNGTITALASGNIASGAAVKIVWNRDGLILDISSLMTDPISIKEIEADIGGTPQNIVNFEWFGNYLTIITDSPGKSQIGFVDNTQYRIWYFGMHTEPGASTRGTYPVILDEIVVKGAAGFSARMLLAQVLELVRVSLGSADTAAGNVDDEVAKAQTALDQMAPTLGQASNALSSLSGESNPLGDVNLEIDLGSAQLVLAATALAKVDSQLGDGHGTLGGAETALSKVTTHVAESITAFGDVSTLITSAASALASANTEAGKANDELTQVDALILTGDESAKGHLDAGDNFLNTIAIGGPNAVGQFVTYAQGRIQIVQALITSANGYTAEASVHVNEGQSYSSAAQAKISEGNARLQIALAFIQEAAQRISISDTHRNLALGYISEARERTQAAAGYFNAASIRVQAAQAILSEAGNYVQQAQTYGVEAGHRINIGQVFASQANAYQTVVNSYLIQVDKWTVEADRRIFEFRDALKDRAQLNVRTVSVSRRQPRT